MNVEIRKEETGRTIKSLAEDKGYSAADIAAALAISQVAVFKWYRGDSMPSPLNMVKLSILLDVEIEDFLVYSTRKSLSDIDADPQEDAAYINKDIVRVNARPGAGKTLAFAPNIEALKILQEEKR